MPASGLRVAGRYGHEQDPPLEGVHVAVRIVNLIAEVQMVQFYVNDRDTSIDCVYEFPMDDNAAVCGLEIELSDRLLIGEVRETNKALEEYSKAISEGQTAVLMEENKPDIFQQRIGNIPPRSRVNIRITYVTELKVDKETGGAIFVLPTSVAPRYSPYNSGSEPIPFATPWQEVCLGRRLSHESSEKADTSVEDLLFSSWTYAIPTFIVDRERPTAFSLTLEAEMPSKVLSVESRTHQLSVVPSTSMANETMAAASLFNEQEPMGKDLEIIIYQEKPFEPSVQLEVLPDGSGCAMMTLVPKFEARPVSQIEIVFVVDCSGSMEGARIEAAKHALGILIQSLPVSCTFNIICFGSSHKALFDQPQPYSQATLKQARSFIQKTSADMGGTDILGPLREIVTSKVTIGASRQMFILTDGQVTNTKEVIQLLRANAHNTRVFTVGIGDEVSRHLVEGMARAAAGTAEFILGKDLLGHGSGAMDSQLINQLTLAMLPSITKIDVDWLGETSQEGTNVDEPNTSTASTQQVNESPSSGLEAFFAQLPGRNAALYQAPFLPPALFSGHKFIVYCFFKPDEMARVSQVNVSALVPGGGDLFLAVPVAKVTSVGRTVHLLGARALVRDLTEDTSHLHFQKSFAQTIRCPYNYSAFSGWLHAPTSDSTSPQDRASAWDLVPINPPYKIVREEMIEISTRFGIVSKETSFLAVERWSDGRSGIAYRPEFQPKILYASGFMDAGASNVVLASGFIDFRMGAGFMCGCGSEEGLLKTCLCAPFSIASFVFNGLASCAQSSMRVVSGALQTRAHSKSTPDKTGLSAAAPPQPVAAADAAPSLDTIVMIPNFDGSIDANESNAKTLGFSTVGAILSLEVYQDIRSEIPDETSASCLCFGIVFLGVLAQRFESDSNKWSLVASKTRSWLTGTLVHLKESEADQVVENWLAKARPSI